MSSKEMTGIRAAVRYGSVGLLTVALLTCACALTGPGCVLPFHHLNVSGHVYHSVVNSTLYASVTVRKAGSSGS